MRKKTEKFSINKFSIGDTVFFKKGYSYYKGDFKKCFIVISLRNAIFLSFWNLRNYLYEKDYVSYINKPTYGMFYDLDKKFIYELMIDEYCVMNYKKIILSEKYIKI